MDASKYPECESDGECKEEEEEEEDGWARQREC